MYYLEQPRTLSSRMAPALVAASFIALPPTQALANPLDDAAEYVATMPSSSAFGLGCAIGAVVGGLVIALVGARSRHRLRGEVDELVDLLERAEEATQRAERMASARINAQARQAARATSSTTPHSSTSEAHEPTPVSSADSTHESVVGTPMHETSRTAVRKPATTESVSTASESGRQTVHAAANKSTAKAPIEQAQDDLGLTVPIEELNALNTSRKTASGSKEQKQPKKLHETLLDQLNDTAGFNMPVINRGQAVEDAEPFYASSSRGYQVNPAVRARIIEKRIPRFDESLFPDIESERHTGVDIFETAMRAMEDSLSAVHVPTTEVETKQEFEFVPPKDHPEISDPKSYIEYLVQDEMERSRSASARRYSHLTMIEGTADLSDSRAVRPRRARHMRVTSKEA